MTSYPSNRVSLFGDTVGSHRVANADPAAWYAGAWENVKPWAEFFDYRRIHVPQLLAVSLRAKKTTVLTNLGYFKFNYVIVFSLIGFMELFTNIPLLLDLVFGGLAVSYVRRLRSQSIRVLLAGKGGRLTVNQLYVIIAVIFVPVLVWCSPVGTLLWLLVTCGGTVMVHALLLDKPLEISINELV